MEHEPWYCVSIKGSESSIRESVALMNALSRKVRSVKLPADATAHHVRREGDHLYYLSPALAVIARDVLEQHASRPVAKKPDLTFARLVDL